MSTEPVDCRSPEGITAGLIDGIIAAARALRDRDRTHPAVIEALRDIADDEDVRSLLDAPTAVTAVCKCPPGCACGHHSPSPAPSPVSAATEATGGTGGAEDA